MYKFLKTGMKSSFGNQVWKKNIWYTIDGPLSICNKGFHCSKEIQQAFSWVQGRYLCIVEVRGDSIIHKDKQCWSEMRVTEAYPWKKKDSVAIAIYAAELVIDNFETEYPNDNRPRKAIEAAKAYLKNPCKRTKDAAADAADAAHAAADAAHAAARAAAWSIARSAESAAWSAWSAWSIARSAARSAEVLQQIEGWFQNWLQEKRAKNV